MLTCAKCGEVVRDMVRHVCPAVPQPKPVVIMSEEVPPETVRGTTHGDYTEMSQVIQETKAIWRSGSSWGKLTAGQKEALELIATKVGRIVTGDPTHLDHWRDGAGYFNKGSESCGS